MSEAPRTGNDRPIDRLLARPLGEAMLDRNTESVARRPAARDADGEMLIFFVRGGELLALPAVNVLRAFPPLPVHRIPHRSGPLFRGIAAERGELRLVGSLEAALDLALAAPAAHGEASGAGDHESPTAEAAHGAGDGCAAHAAAVANAAGYAASLKRMLLVDVDGDSWLVEVDAVVGVHRSNRETWVEPPATVSQGRRRVTSFVVPLGLRRAALLDPARLVALFSEAIT